MSTNRNTAATPAEPGAGQPAANPVDAPPVTSTVTYYQQAAAAFMRQFDELAATLALEAHHTSTAKFVRSHLSVPTKFMATVIAAVEQTVELQNLGKLDAPAARETLQFIEAFRPVVDKFVTFARNLQFTMNSRQASLSADTLQVYDIAKGLARDPNSAHIEALVQNMQRDLGFRGRAKAAALARRAAAEAAAAGAGPAPKEAAA